MDILTNGTNVTEMETVDESNLIEYIDYIQTVLNSDGSDVDEQAKAQALLITVKEFVAGYVQVKRELESEILQLNEKNSSLTVRNNELFRKVANHDIKREKAIEMLQPDEELAELI